MTIGERIKTIRKDLGLTLEQFGDKIGVTKSTVSRLENDGVSLTNQTATAICATFNVREEWLRYGEGEPFRQLSPDEQLAEWMGEVMSEDESDIQRRVVKFLSKLTPAEWEMIADMAHKFVEELKKGEE